MVGSRSSGAAGGQMVLQLTEEVQQLLLLPRRQGAEEVDDPSLVLGGHAAELALTLGSESDAEDATVGGVDLAHDQAFLLQAVRDPGDIAPGHHHALRELAHLQALRGALQLRHEVEARQRGVEARLQVLADPAPDLVGAGEEPQPQAQRHVMVIVYPRLRIERRRQRLQRALLPRHQVVTSPPASTMLWPVTLSVPGRQSQSTALLTSAGAMRRPCGLVAVRVAIASLSLRPVFFTMLSTARVTMSVSVYPGHTAFTVMFRVAYSKARERVKPITACFEVA